MTRNTHATPTRNTTSYQVQLKTALKLYHQPQQLGAESLLATPYFLGNALPTTITHLSSSQHRGEILQAELLAAAASLLSETPPRNRQEMAALLDQVRQDPDAPGYAYLVLELRCFQRYFKVQKTAEIWESEALLPGSRAEHYRDFDRAVDLLGDALLDRLRPNIRLEPTVAPAHQIGYAAEYGRALTALQERKSVTICGVGGVGKTTLGANLAADTHFSGVLWYTFRRGFNENLQSLLFALAHFLHQHGASALWRQLAVGQSEEIHLVLGLLQKDLQNLRDQPLLLCFDEMELFQPTSMVSDNKTQRELLEFLRTLHGQLAILYMGQTALLETDLYCELHGLTSEQLATLLQTEGHQLAPAEIQALHDYTHGNPRLLRLALLLLQPGQTIANLLESLPRSPAIQPIWQRVWQRLDPTAHQILQQLAVFRRVAPADHWQQIVAPLANLIHQGLVQEDGYGGIELLPVLRDTLYQQLATAPRHALHLGAAEICAMRGDYTEAAYHYTQGGDPASAIQIWYPYRRQEVLRGQSGAALNIFTTIVPADLPRAEQKALALSLAELHQRHGDPQQGLATLVEEQWESTEAADARAHELQAQFLEALGRNDEAEQSYGVGMQSLMRLQQNLVHLQCQQGLLHARHRNTKQMRQYLLQARWETQRLQGMIEESEGRFSEAHISYQSALAMAQGTGNHADITVIQFALARILARLGKYVEALSAAEDAIAHCEASSDWFTLAQLYANLAAIHKDAGHFDEALQAGQRALSQFRMMQAPHWIGLTAVNLAETYIERKDWANAERYAQEAIDQQAPHSYPYGIFALGCIRRAQQAVDVAKELFANSLEAAQENEDRFMEAHAQRALGNILLEGGDIEQGTRHLQNSLWLFEQVGTIEEVAATAQILEEIVQEKAIDFVA